MIHSIIYTCTKLYQVSILYFLIIEYINRNIINNIEEEINCKVFKQYYSISFKSIVNFNKIYIIL